MKVEILSTAREFIRRLVESDPSIAILATRKLWMTKSLYEAIPDNTEISNTNT